MVPRALRIPVRPADDDVVPDSEPEREQRRLLHTHARRRVKRKLAHTQSDVSLVVVSSDDDELPIARTLDDSVIEISSSSDGDRVGHIGPSPPIPPRTAHNNRGADTDSSLDESAQLPSIREILGLPRQPPATTTRTAARNLPPATSVVTNDFAPGHPTGDEELSPPPRPTRALDIARFAYAGSSRTVSRAPSLSSGRSTPAVLPRPLPAPTGVASTSSAVAPLQPAAPIPEPNAPAPRPVKPRKTSRTMFLDGVSDADIGRLRRCVCCELAWTVRKTAPQKSKHIAACAAKRALTPDTVQVLVRAEVRRVRDAESAEGSGSGGGKGKGKAKAAVAAEEEPATLLAARLDGGARKRPGPRRPVVETVRELAETRTGILERARLLLGGGAAPVQRDLARFADGPVEEDAVEGDAPPATQPFGESALARAYRPATAALLGTQAPVHAWSPPREPAFPANSDGREDDAPPATQPFGASALAARLGGSKPQRVFLSKGDEEESPPRTQPFAASALAKRFGARVVNLDLDSDSDADVDKAAGGKSAPQSPPRHVFHEVSNSSPRRADSDDEWADDGWGLPTVAHSANANAARATAGLGSLREVPGLGGWEGAGRGDDHHDVLDDENRDDGAREALRHDEHDYGHDGHDYDGGWADDAVIHFDPGDASASSSDAPLRTQASAASAPRRKSPARNAPAPPKRKRTKRAQSVGSDASDGADGAGVRGDGGADGAGGELSDAALHAALRARIAGDAALYGKVLRYEPVPFAAFLALAADLDTGRTRGRGKAAGKGKGKGKAKEAGTGKSRGKGKVRGDEGEDEGGEEGEKALSGRFRLRVRDFLDAQAIHFHGDTVGRSRTRKKR
ncbi:hypothetical protein PsYK624_004610 [Phanerochaete sordida]|uniref:Uncharacterized protein n=1 Tax=Phanerochaete sordida TaxID=48140 RepID=A0A9P3L6Z6_9APHY|nr:hypothetical protein PsYK624_004610 [Phanerochaete sordida]